MKVVNGILIVLVVIMALAVALSFYLRDNLRRMAVRSYIERCTEQLLAGSAMPAAEKARIRDRLGEFYAMAVDKAIPDRSVTDLWNGGTHNLGLWYFFIQNYFRRSVMESDLDPLARDKAGRVVDLFLWYVKDGRVMQADIDAMGEALDIRRFTQPAFAGMTGDDIVRALRHLEQLNGELDHRAPGAPLDPAVVFKELVDRVERTMEQYRPGGKTDGR
ncbi:MAG: hypothetical protein ABIF71_06935 [Planctomycetota bacterium]